MTAAGVTFSGLALDRAQALRDDPDQVQRLLAMPAARAVAATAAGVLLDEGPPAGLRRLAVRSDVTAANAILLGLENDRPLFALDLGEGHVEGVAPLRRAGAVLPHDQAALAAYAVALLNWHRRHPHCAACGALTDLAEAGYSRRCPACGATHFPRTDPAVIVLVHDDERVLLGRHSDWPELQYSVIAGFVSPGESLEEAVIREVLEESGIEIGDPRFVTSQPWPFPSSLMLGFEARANGGEPVARDGELEDVRWFAAEEIRAALEGDTRRLRIPPGVSIARYLLERWTYSSPRG